MATISLDQFVHKHDGDPVDEDLQFGAQCWDLAEAYCREVLGIPAKPYALPTKDGTAYGSYLYKTELGLSKYFSRLGRKSILGIGIINSRPQRGDLVYWLPTLPGSGAAGHVDICLSNTKDNKHGFLGFDQNWSGKYAHRVTHDFAYVAGYMRPKAAFK